MASKPTRIERWVVICDYGTDGHETAHLFRTDARQAGWKLDQYHNLESTARHRVKLLVEAPKRKRKVKR